MRAAALLSIAGLSALCAVANAQTLDPFFAADYSINNLGSVPGVPPNYGGIAFMPGDPDTLLIGGAANGGSGAIYSIRVTRDSDQNITGFDGTATLLATAPNIDGGLDFTPDGVMLATGFPVNTLMQYRPGSTAPDRTDSLTSLGIGASVGTLRVVPPGFAGAGRLKIASYGGGGWYDAQLAPDGSGTFDIVNVSAPIQINGGPEGIVYVNIDNPGFTIDSVLVTEYSTGRVVAYEIDANGDPIPATRRFFITGLGGAEGAALDPVTGQFMFSTFGGGGQVVVVRGFRICPPCIADYNNSGGTPDDADVAAFFLAWSSSDTCADANRSGGTPDDADVADFFAAWNEGGC